MMSVRVEKRILESSSSGHRGSAAGKREAAAEPKQVGTTERLTLRADEFELLAKAEAEAFLAARYCLLTEAGWPLGSALALAKRTEIDLEDAPSHRAAYACEPAQHMAAEQQAAKGKSWAKVWTSGRR
jgi:hypothetical protein